MDPVTLAAIQAGLSGIQILGGAAGSFFLDEKYKPFLDPRRLPTLDKTDKYEVGGDYGLATQMLLEHANKGFSADARRSIEKKMTDTERALTSIAKETSGGSGANAFNRTLAGTIATGKGMTDFLLADEQMKNRNLQLATDALMKGENLKMLAHNADVSATLQRNSQKLQKANLGYQMATKERDEWSDTMGAGFNNLFDTLKFWPTA